MNGQKNVQLKFFQRLLWLDPNMNIKKELGYFSWFFGDYLDFSFSIQGSKDFQLSRFQRVLVMCSSRLIKQTYHAYLNEANFFPKMIVFCGSPARAKQITQTSPYRQAILNAYYQEASIVDAVTTLDAKLFKDPGLMNLRVQITESKQEQKKQPINQNQGQQKSKKQIRIDEKKQDEGKKKSEKKVDKKKPKQKKQKEEKNQKKEQKKEQYKKKYQLKKDSLVCFAVKDGKQEKQMRKKIIDGLEKEGISVRVQKFEDMKYSLQQILQKCTLISHASNQLEQLKGYVNRLQLTIRLYDEGKKQEQGGQDGDVFLNSIGEVIEKLKDIDFIE